MTDVDEVWTATRYGSVLHLYPSCYRLQRARQVYGPKDRACFPDDATICSRCRGVEKKVGGGGAPHVESLKEAAGK